MTIKDLTHKHYEVTFSDHVIHTVVTADPSMVNDWISQTESIHHSKLNHLVVGLDVEWIPNDHNFIRNPVATIQLCVGHSCLIFQPIYASYIPKSIHYFVENDQYTFVGVGIESVAEKVLADYGLEILRKVDLRGLAADHLNNRELRNAGLKDLAREVLQKKLVKPKRVTMSTWDEECLTLDQIEYACVNAFVSFEIGKTLEAWK